MISALVDIVRGALRRLVGILESFGPTAIVIVMIRNAGAHGVSDMAAAVGYYGIVALFPLIIFTITLLSFVLSPEAVSREVEAALAVYLPSAEMLVGDNIDAVLGARGAIGVISLVALLWSSSSVFSALTRFMDRAWGVAKPDAFHLVRFRSMVMVLSVSGLLLLSLVSSALVHLADDLANVEQWGRLGDVVRSGEIVLLWLFSLGGVILAVLMLYRWLPSDRTPWGYVIPAAIVAGVLLEIIKNLFLLYLTRFANLGAVYGPLATVMVLLLWIYITSFAVLLVAELGGAVREVRSRR